MNTTARDVMTVAKRLLNAPVVQSRNGYAHEYLAQSYTFMDPDPGFTIPGRGLSDTIRVIEMLTLCGQWDISHRMPEQFNRYKNDSLLRGAYGQRLYGQLTDVHDELLIDKQSRRAVVTIYDGHRDLADRSNDVPCTLSLQFLIRDNKLWTVANMRSSDAFLGLPYDVAQFTAVSKMLGASLNLDVAALTINCGSSHLYVKDELTVEELDVPDPMETRWTELFEPEQSIGEYMEQCRRLLEGDAWVWDTQFQADAHDILKGAM